jgi:purine-nucleoside phosphorylase
MFQSLFGIGKAQVQKTCVLLPLAAADILAGLGTPCLAKGKLYSTGNGRGFTAVRTGVGPALAGDAVLWLGETSCETIILFGSCGLTGLGDGLGIGSLLCPTACYAAESFTVLLEKKSDAWDAYRPDSRLLGTFMESAGPAGVTPAICLSIGSLKLQDELLPLIRSKGVQAVDMECASVYAAARHTARRAVALFYASDIIGEKPFHSALSRQDTSTIHSSMTKAGRLLCDVIEQRLSG